MAQPNWAKIRARYERGGISHRDLAEAEDVPYPTLRDRAKREGWTASAQQVRSAIVAKTSQKVVERASSEAADYVLQHTNDWQSIRNALMAVIEADFEALTEDQIEELKAKAAFAMGASQTFERIQKGQRLSLGLDKEKPPGGEGGDGNEQPLSPDEFRSMDPAERRRRIGEALRPDGNGQR
jgi:hypothetical protein